ncbi:MAG TPA: glycosyltransferase family 1 protein [Planctomycetaceae bacterium]|nr:glycosyltransferase family 1 protein [Planctomycetaceae bacterium]
MKIVHVITRMILGGAQENTLLSVEGQQDDWGDDVTLITGPSTGPEGSLLERAAAGGRQVRLLPELCRAVSPWNDWRSHQVLVRWLAELGPDIVHTHSSKAGILGRSAAWKLGLPVVHTIHGSPFHPYQSRLANRAYRWAEGWAARRCDRLISVCDAMTDQYVAAGIAPRGKFVTVYSGMEVEPFLHPPRPRDVVRRELGLGPGEVVVAKVARLFELKGHDDVIAAAPQVIAANPQVRFLFIGDGILQSTLQQQIARLGLTPYFLFTGLVPPQRVPELLGASDIVVHASLREGLARVLPQGLIAGKPVVSYDIDGAREVVIPGATGCLLKPRDIPALVSALLELAGDTPLRDRLGSEGRRRFTDQFRTQTMTRRLREIYHEVLRQRNPPTRVQA